MSRFKIPGRGHPWLDSYRWIGNLLADVTVDRCFGWVFLESGTAQGISRGHYPRLFGLHIAG